MSVRMPSRPRNHVPQMSRVWSLFFCLTASLAIQIEFYERAGAAVIADPVEVADFSPVFEKALELRYQGASNGHKKVLVAFDTDNTLIFLNQTLGSEQWFEIQNKERGARSFTSLLSVNDAVLPASGVRLTEAAVWIDPLTVEGVKSMVITSRGSVLAEPTMASFDHLGIHFSFDGQINFAGPSSDIPCISGVCFTSGQDKGKALLGFLNAQKEAPDAVIFVDNDPDYPNGHIQHMINAVQAAGVPFDLYTYRYTRYNNTIAQYEASDRSAAVAELLTFTANGCLQRSCAGIMDDASASAWAAANCPGRTKDGMVAQMNHLIYGDPIPQDLLPQVCNDSN